MSTIGGLFISASKEVVNWTGMLLALAQLALIWYALHALIAFDVKATNHDILLVVITAIITKYGTTVDFFFGGSAMNKKQAETIAAQATTIAAQNTTVAETTVPSEPKIGV